MAKGGTAKRFKSNRCSIKQYVGEIGLNDMACGQGACRLDKGFENIRVEGTWLDNQ